MVLGWQRRISPAGSDVDGACFDGLQAGGSIATREPSSLSPLGAQRPWASGYVDAYRSVITQSIAASTSDTRAVATEIRVSDIP